MIVCKLSWLIMKAVDNFQSANSCKLWRPSCVQATNSSVLMLTLQFSHPYVPRNKYGTLIVIHTSCESEYYWLSISLERTNLIHLCWRVILFYRERTHFLIHASFLPAYGHPIHRWWGLRRVESDEISIKSMIRLAYHHNHRLYYTVVSHSHIISHHVKMAYLNTCVKSYSILFKWSGASIFPNRAYQTEAMSL